MKNKIPESITFSEFKKVVIQAGTITRVEEFPEAHKPAYKVWVHLGNNVIKKSSAQITKNYTPKQLINKQVICVTNLEPRQIGNFMSEILITGFEDEKGNIILAKPDGVVEDGKILY